MRKRKAFYRRVAYLAKQDSKEVTYRHNWISIDDTVYRVEDIAKIPSQYCPKDFILDDISTQTYAGIGARPKTYTQANSVPKRQPATVCLLPAPTTQTDQVRPSPNEKIRLTKAGLLFSGPSAFEFEIAEKIMRTENTWEIMDLTENIVPDFAWERLSPHKLYELNKAKYDQNPALRKRLIETAPHRLIEASKSKKWGGGAPFSDPIYDKFGDTLTRHRDELIAALAIT